MLQTLKGRRKRDKSHAQQSRVDQVIKKNRETKIQVKGVEVKYEWTHWKKSPLWNYKLLLLCWECIVGFCCCGVLVFMAFSFLFFSFLFFCCLILLIQSQSLSRRTTPFAPRVQVMGPVWRAQSLFGLCSLTVDWPFFCFHTLENAFPGKWQLQVSLSVQCIVSFSSVWFLGTTVMMRVIITHFNPFTSFYQGSACSTNRTHSKRHSSIAWIDSWFWPDLVSDILDHWQCRRVSLWAF